MPRANLKRKSNSVICAVREPEPDNTRQWREVKGVIMEAGSQENIKSWYDIFREMASECQDWKRVKKRNR